MIDPVTACELARKGAPAGVAIDEANVRELDAGWFFPYQGVDGPWFGGNGVIVNKETGKRFELGSRYPIERDLKFYDLGYQFESYDLVVTRVSDLSGTLDTLRSFIAVVEPEYQHGTVWRIGRPITGEELR